MAFQNGSGVSVVYHEKWMDELATLVVIQITVIKITETFPMF